MRQSCWFLSSALCVLAPHGLGLWGSPAAAWEVDVHRLIQELDKSLLLEIQVFSQCFPKGL